MNLFLLAATSALAVTPSPSLAPGDGMLFACFLRTPEASKQAELRGIGLFLPKIAPSAAVSAEDVRDPSNLLSGGSFDTVKASKNAYTFSGGNKLSLRAQGGAMFQADLKMSSGETMKGLCQGGPAGDRANALAFFDGLITRMTSPRETDSQ